MALKSREASFVTRALRFLITRTEPDAARTAEAIIALGGSAVIAPLRETVGAEEPVPTRPNRLIATSANAFRYGLAIPEAWHALPLLIVGERTEKAARDAGLTGVACHFAEVSAMIAHLADHPFTGSNVYLAGEPRRPELEAFFTANRQQFEVWLRYRMRDVPILPASAVDALMGGAVDIVLHYSAESARSYFRLARKAGLLNMAAAPVQACLSPAVAEAVRDAACESRIIIADQPRGDALVKAVFIAFS